MIYLDGLESISEYLSYHDMLDEFVWLIRLYYAPKSIIKSKKYRVSELFQYYLDANIKIDKVKRNIFSPKANNADKFIYYLKQGWYNELATDYPFNPMQDDLSTKIGSVSWENCWKTELFPSWAIVKTYYTVYSFYNSLVFTNYENTDTFNHRNMTNSFNTTLLKKFSKYTVFYPFNIFYDGHDINPAEYRTNNRDEWKYRYSLCPRTKHLEDELPASNLELSDDEIVEIIRRNHEKREPNTFFDLEETYFQNLTDVRNTLKCKAPVNILDAMYLFRTWANYSGSDTICKLQKGGYLRYLEKNLYAISYFIAGIAEVSAIGFLGVERYASVFNEFYNTVIRTKREFIENWNYLSLLNRHCIYSHFGYLPSQDIMEYVPENYKFNFIK